MFAQEQTLPARPCVDLISMYSAELTELYLEWMYMLFSGDFGDEIVPEVRSAEVGEEGERKPGEG